MEKEKRSTEELVEYYKPDVERLYRYLPYFEGKRANDVAQVYRGDGSVEQTMVFPVYDSTLLAFIKEVQQTVFLDYNYRYIYTRNMIHNHKDEWDKIDMATITDMDMLGGMLSKYVLGGMTKSVLWKEAVEFEIFYRVIQKMHELIKFWDAKTDYSRNP